VQTIQLEGGFAGATASRAEEFRGLEELSEKTYDVVFVGRPSSSQVVHHRIEDLAQP
jgi:hypothetical protein